MSTVTSPDSGNNVMADWCMIYSMCKFDKGIFRLFCYITKIQVTGRLRLRLYSFLMGEIFMLWDKKAVQINRAESEQSFRSSGLTWPLQFLIREYQTDKHLCCHYKKCNSKTVMSMWAFCLVVVHESTRRKLQSVSVICVTFVETEHLPSNFWRCKGSKMRFCAFKTDAEGHEGWQ